MYYAGVTSEKKEQGEKTVDLHHSGCHMRPGAKGICLNIVDPSTDRGNTRPSTTTDGDRLICRLF